MAQAAPRGLAAKPHPGPEVRISDERPERLEPLLFQGATAHGRPNALRSAQRVAETIRRNFGIAYHAERARKFLRDRPRPSSQKPREKAKRRDAEKIDHRRREELPESLNKARERESRLAFLDESGFQPTPVVRRTYAPRGRTPILEAYRRKGKVSAIGAVTVGPKGKRRGSNFRLPPDNADARGEDTVSFLKRSKERLKGPPTILLDRGEIHQRCGVARRYLVAPPEVVTEEFPGYAPDANPDEGFGVGRSIVARRTSLPKPWRSCVPG